MTFCYISLPFIYLHTTAHPPVPPNPLIFPVLSSQLCATLSIYTQEDTVQIIQNGMHL